MPKIFCWHFLSILNPTNFCPPNTWCRVLVLFLFTYSTYVVFQYLNILISVSVKRACIREASLVSSSPIRNPPNESQCSSTSDSCTCEERMAWAKLPRAFGNGIHQDMGPSTRDLPVIGYHRETLNFWTIDEDIWIFSKYGPFELPMCQWITHPDLSEYQSLQG